SVDPQIVNPCGHTVCAPCGMSWLYSKRGKTCPICRTKVNVLQPYFSNIIVKNLVETFVQLCQN
ncbi:hypothetical protein C8J55DRAFT_388587, partial [Lentinula edodes]